MDNKASRFGNPAFRTFYDKVSEVCNYASRPVMLLTAFRYQTTYTRPFPISRQKLSLKSLPTSANHGETALE